MYKFLMVDDEDIIRTGFQNRIDWTALGFEFLPPCVDGREAIERIEQLRPDVVITDICMPFLDGIGLSAWIAANYPDILVLVLSGYDDFEYARASIRNRVFDYILKPITSRDLQELLLRVRTKLDELSGLDRERQDERQRSLDIRRDEGLRRLLWGPDEDVAPEIAMELFGADAAARHYAVARLDVEAVGVQDKVSRELAQSRLQATIRSVLSPLGTGPNRNTACLVESFAGLPPRLVITIIFHDLSGQRVPKLADYLSATLRDALDRSGFRAGAGIGGVHSGLAGIALACREAALACEYRVVQGWGIFHYLASRETATQAALDLDLLSARFRTVIRTGTSEELGQLIAEVRSRLAGSSAGIRRIRLDIQALFSVVADLLTGNLEAEDAAGREAVDLYYHITDHLLGMDDLERHLGKLGALAMDAVRQKGAGSSERKVLEFKEYIAAHYASQDLSITRVGNDLNVSPSYLSKILKRHLDRSFVEYLTEYRLERAKELLAGSDLMTYQIAEVTGYPDARYFSSIFKKQTGSTPSEYRMSRRTRVQA